MTLNSKKNVKLLNWLISILCLKSQSYKMDDNTLLLEYFMVLAGAHECIIDKEEKKDYIVY